MMGCFSACFTTSKHRKSQKLPDKVSSGNQIQESHEALQPTKPTKQDTIDNPSNLITEPKYESEELSDRSTKKKVTFDLNVKTQCCLVEHKEETQNESQALLGSNVSISVSNDNPPNHRYQNCTSSDDECEDMDLVESDSDEPHSDGGDNDSDQALVQEEESSESLFSISIGRQSSAAEMGSKEVNSPITIHDSPEEELKELKSVGLNQSGRNKSQHVVLSVLSPVENLTQWKVVKANTIPDKYHQDKENMMNIEHELNIGLSEEPSFRFPIQKSKPKSKHQKPETREIAVDTSFSSWLVESEMAQAAQNSLNSIGTSSPPQRANSAASFEDRPILGAMTVEEIKKLSEFSSPRRSPRRCSPDEIPIIGTVGSYWSHTGHTVDSESSSSSSRGMSYTSNQYREEKSVNCQSTPFETRLDSGIAQV